MNKKIWWILGVFVLIIVVLVVLKKQGVIGQETTIRVAAEEAGFRTIIETVSASGKVYPEDERKVSSDISGEVVEMMVEEGDRVQKGQTLARVFADVLTSARDRASFVVNQQEAQTANIEASLDAFKARLDLARQNLDRQKKLWNDRVISKAELEQAEAQFTSAEADLKAATQGVKSSKAGIKSAQASLTEADKNLNRTAIIAPMDGIVSLLAVKKGERVAGNSFSLGTEILRVADMSKIEVRVDVGENDIPKVKIGDSAIVEVDAYNDRTFMGVVTRISSSSTAAQSVVQTATADVTNYKVYIRINPESYADLQASSTIPFRPGMSASADIITQRKEKVLSVPILSVATRDKFEEQKSAKESEADAVKNKEGEGAKEDSEINIDNLEVIVFVVQADGTVKKQAIQTGIQDNEYIEVIGGLKSGEKIVSAPYNQISKVLKTGDKVKVVPKDQVYENK